MRSCPHKPTSYSIDELTGSQCQCLSPIRLRQRLQTLRSVRVLDLAPASCQPQFHFEIWDGLLQSFLQPKLRLPLQYRAGSGDIGLALLRVADAARVLDKGKARLIACDAVDRFRELQNGHLYRV